MPAPDPSGVTIERHAQGYSSLLIETFMLSGRTQRMARARRIVQNLRRDGWLCLWCAGPVPEFRRADARYCCEGCRKRAKRANLNRRNQAMTVSDLPDFASP